MPQTRQSDFRTPFSGKSSKKLRGRIDRVVSNQAAAASGSDLHVLDVAGDIQSLSVITAANPASGESLVIDVQRNGVTILTAPLTLNNTTPGKVLYNFTPVAGTRLNLGDVITFVRTYTAGGGATPVGPNRIILEVA